MERSPSLLMPDQLIRGRVYRLHCRNLNLGVWDGKRSFIGVRTKFGSRFLSEEDHWDVDEHYGTVSEAIDTGYDVPPEISLETREGLLAWLIQLEDGTPDFESGADALEVPEPDGSGSVRS